MRGLVLGFLLFSLVGAVYAATPANNHVPDYIVDPGAICPVMLPDSAAKLELVNVKSIVKQEKYQDLDGTFRFTNLGPTPIELGGYRQVGVFKVEFPLAQEGVRHGPGKWTEGVNGMVGTFMMPSERLTIAAHSSEEFVTELRPTFLPGWGPLERFHLVVGALKPKACVMSAEFALDPPQFDGRYILSAVVDPSSMCPNKIFDKDISLRLVDHAGSMAKPLVPGHPAEELGVFELTNHRDSAIQLEGVRQKSGFYISNPITFIQDQFKVNNKPPVWFTQLYDTVSHPDGIDILTVAPGTTAKFISPLGETPVMLEHTGLSRLILLEQASNVCALSESFQSHYTDPHPLAGPHP